MKKQKWIKRILTVLGAAFLAYSFLMPESPRLSEESSASDIQNFLLVLCSLICGLVLTLPVSFKKDAAKSGEFLSAVSFACWETALLMFCWYLGIFYLFSIFISLSAAAAIYLFSVWKPKKVPEFMFMNISAQVLFVVIITVAVIAV